MNDNFAPWILALQPVVTAIDDTGATLRIPMTPDIMRTGNIVSGQTLATLADTAMVIGCGDAAGEMIPVGTVTLDMQFLRPATRDAIDAKAEITRLGRGMAFARCTLTALPSGKPVALATATFARQRRDSSAELRI
ncbi:MAG: PaaI family thioesterase [Pseudomonadota bacterium]